MHFITAFIDNFFCHASTAIIHLLKAIFGRSAFDGLTSVFYSSMTSTVFFYDFSNFWVVYMGVYTYFIIRLAVSLSLNELYSFFRFLGGFGVSLKYLKAHIWNKAYYQEFFFEALKSVNIINIKKLLVSSGMILAIITLLFIVDLIIQCKFQSTRLINPTTNLYEVNFFSNDLVFDHSFVYLFASVLFFYLIVHSTLGIYNVSYDYVPDSAFCIFLSYLVLLINSIYVFFFFVFV